MSIRSGSIFRLSTSALASMVRLLSRLIGSAINQEVLIIYKRGQVAAKEITNVHYIK